MLGCGCGGKNRRVSCRSLNSTSHSEGRPAWMSTAYRNNIERSRLHQCRTQPRPMIAYSRDYHACVRSILGVNNLYLDLQQPHDVALMLTSSDHADHIVADFTKTCPRLSLRPIRCQRRDERSKRAKRRERTNRAACMMQDSCGPFFRISNILDSHIRLYRLQP